MLNPSQYIDSKGNESKSILDSAISITDGMPLHSGSVYDAPKGTKPALSISVVEKRSKTADRLTYI